MTSFEKCAKAKRLRDECATVTLVAHFFYFLGGNMFTGIIEEVGVVKAFKKSSEGALIDIGAEKVLDGVAVGDSIAVKGACLTVESIGQGRFVASVMNETLRATNLSNLRVGDKVNLERAVAVGARLGGHIVTGHVDGTGLIKKIGEDGGARVLTIGFRGKEREEKSLMKFIALKGSVTVDGVSLTVMDMSDAREEFSLSLVRHTQSATTLFQSRARDVVNIEVDILAKYIARQLEVGKRNGGDLLLGG